MKQIFATAIVGIGLATIATAEETTGPLIITDHALDNIVAGVGANNVAVAPWDALDMKAGHSLNHNLKADNNMSPHLGGVAVPGAVPNSVCMAFC